MGYTNEELTQRFLRGETDGKCNRMAIEQVDENGSTILWDYGWAVLAYRDGRTGNIYVYKGWDGYSQTTSQHYNLIDPEPTPNQYPFQYELGTEDVRVVVSGTGAVETEMVLPDGSETPVPDGGSTVYVVDADPKLKSGSFKHDRPELEGVDPDGVDGNGD